MFKLYLVIRHQKQRRFIYML